MSKELSNNAKNGLGACIEAFERLKAGAPNVPGHVGIVAAKVTSGIVSVEAGFDRGYLKKSRASHLPLIAQIEAFRVRPESTGSSKANEVKRAKSKAERAKSELEQTRRQLYEVLTQNLQLVERVRDLEGMLAQRGGNGKIQNI
ncbi:MAG TPA: hypothetical protein VF682_24110 [Pseudomonas sp.]|jgi:hypothetical protein